MPPVVRSPRANLRSESPPQREPFSVGPARKAASFSPSPSPRRRSKNNAENFPPEAAVSDTSLSPALSKPYPKVAKPGHHGSPGLPPRPPAARPPPVPPLSSHVTRPALPSGTIPADFVPAVKRKLKWEGGLHSPSLGETHSLNLPSALDLSDNGVKVIVRIRPMNKKEEQEEAIQIVQRISADCLSLTDQQFTFDTVLGPEASQQAMFEMVGMPLVENCLAGFNSSIFAYGQTGSGKTYTMWGAIADDPVVGAIQLPNEGRGLAPRVFECLFSCMQKEEKNNTQKQLRFQCRCSFLEIYNEQITDLLDPGQKNLQIREAVKTGVYVENLTEEFVSSSNDVVQLLQRGLANRRVGTTNMNAESSRSHTVFTFVIESRCKSIEDGVSSVRRSRMNLVDLAGSERQKLTGAAGERLKEAGNINRSLSQLGNLINILGEASQSGKQRHIPYRDSRLTFLLQESLGGNAKLVMICAVSPANSSQRETMSTLRFAQRAKAIQNKAVVNEERENDVNFLREQIRQLRDELMRMKQNEPGSSSSSSAMGGGNGYSTSWNARRSYNLLKISLSHPLTLPQTDSDSDEEMEIEDDRVESMDVVRCSSSSDEKESVTEKDCELQSAKKNEWGNDAESGNGKEDRFRMEIVAESGDVKEQCRTEIVAETGNEKEQCRGGIVAEILNDEDLCRTENVVENGNNEEQSRSEIVAEAGNAEEQCRMESVPETGNKKQQCGRIVAEIVNDEDLCMTENVVENGNNEEQRRSEIVAEAGNAEKQCRMEIVPETGKEKEQCWVGIVAETEKDEEQWTEVVAENGNDEQCRTENANLQEEAEANPLVSKVLSVPDLNHQEAIVLENDCILENEIESFKAIEPAENCEHKNGIESSKAMSPAENLRKDESTTTEDEASEIVEHITNVITEVSEESSAFKCDRGTQSDFNLQMEECYLNVESEEEKIIENLAAQEAQEAKKTELVREEVISKASLYGGGSDAKEGNLAEDCSAVVVAEGIEFLFNSKLSKAAELEASDVTGLSLNMPKYDEDPHNAEKKVENLIKLSVFTKESDAKEESLAEDCSAMVVDDGIEFPFNPKPSEDAELKGSDVTGHRLNMPKHDDPQDADKSLENLIEMSVFTKEDKGSSLDGELHSSETVLSSNGLESNNEVIINDSSCGPELRKSSLRSPVLSISPQLSSPVLESPILSVSPRIRDDGKRRSELTALAETSLQNWHTEEPAAEFKTPLPSGKENLAKKKKASVASSKNMAAASPTERLAASLHRGLQILDNHQLNMNSLRRSSVRFSFQNLEPIKTPPPPPIRGVEKGVQTSPKLFADGDRDKDSSAMETLQVPDDKSKWQLVPVDNPSTPMSQSTSTITHLSKTVEAVLAGAIRREQSAEEALSRKDAEIEQLARLVRQYKHERECNQVLQQSREDKIGRLEGLMDGIIPSDAFINEEWVSLVEEHKILQEKYDNHPEVTQANVELQCLRGELEQYRKFFDLGEKEVLLEEIQDLRNQLQYCIDTPRLRKQRQLYLTPAAAVEEEGVCPPQETEGPTMEISTESFEVARKQWEEQEAEWMSTLEELRSEVEACRQLADKRKQELECEQQCSAETREALEMAMAGHARLLDQYADLQEKHIALLAKQRKIKESVAEVKRKAGKAGLKETRFVEAQAAELAAFKLEMEQERMAAKLKIDGLQSQLRDTAEAVQAAGELLVRLKEAEETVLLAQDSAAIAEQESDALRRKVEKLKRRHATELATLQQRILETRLQRGALCPMCAMAERVKFQFPEVDPLQAQAAMEAEQLAALKEAEPINHHHLHYLEGEDPPLLNPDKDLHHDDDRWYKELGTCNY